MACANPGSDTLHGLVEASAKKWPETQAVVYDDGTRVQRATYGDLLTVSDQVCSRLRLAGVHQEVVAVSVGGRLHLPAILTGIMKVPAAFLPVSLHVGGATLNVTLTRLKVRVALVDLGMIETLTNLLTSHLRIDFWDDLGLGVVWLGNTRGQFDWGNPLAYVITTSGSTGIPKLVRVPHACIVPNVTHISALYGLTPRDVSVLMSPLTFDPSIVEIFAALSCGSRLLLVPDVIKMVPGLFGDVITKHGVTVMQASPSVAWSLGLLTSPRPLGLRVLSLGGEACPHPGALRALRHHGNGTMTLVTLYGVTEVSSWALYHVITEEDLSSGMEIPLGTLLHDTEYEVRDDGGGRVTEGEGQLYVGSRNRMCLLDDEMSPPADGLRATGDRVCIDTEGRLWYRGRTDRQVKRHGMRLDLDGLERVTVEMSGVCRSTAVFSDQHQGALHLVLQTTPRTDQDSQPQGQDEGSSHGLRVEKVLEAELRHHLHQRLPAQYSPDGVWVVDSLPYTRHGKLDQTRLVDMISELDGRSCKANLHIDRKDILEQLWKACLNLPADYVPGDTDRLLTSGGDSFTAVRLLNELTQRLGDLDPSLLEVILTETYFHVLDILEGRKADRELTDKTDLGLEQQLTPGIRKDHQGETLNHKLKHGAKRPGESIFNDQKEAKKQALASSASFDYTSIQIPGPEEWNPESPIQQNKLDHVRHGVNQSLEHPGSIERHKAGNPTLTEEGKTAIFSSPVSCSDKCVFALSRTNRLTHLCPHDRGKQCAVTMETEVKVTREDHNVTSDRTTPRLDLQLEWSWDTGKCIDASPLILVRGSLGFAFIGSHSHKFAAVSLDTGRLLWETVLGDRVESSACISPAGDCVVVGCYDGLVYVLDIHTGHVVWTFATRGQVKSSPCMDLRTRLVYVGSHDQHLYALSIENKTCQWSRNLKAGSVYSSPTACQSVTSVYVGTLGGQLVALHSVSGELSWQQSVGKPLFSSPCLIPCGVAVGCVDGHVYAFSHLGQKMWTIETAGPVFSSPSYMDILHTTYLSVDRTASNTRDQPSDRVVFGCHDKYVYCVDLQGQVVWRFEAGSEVFASPWIIPDLTQSALQNVTELPGPCSQVVDSELRHSNASCDPLVGKKEDREQCQEPKVATGFSNHEGDHNLNYPKLVDSGSSDCKSKEKAKICGIDNYDSRERIGPVVIVCTTKGCICVLKMSNGELLTTFVLDGPVFSSPVVHGDSVYVGCRDNRLYRLKLTSR